MNRLFLLLLFFALQGCNNSQPDELQEYEVIRNHFGKYQIQDLKKILKFFDHSVCAIENLDKGNLNNCWDKYFARIANELESGNLNINISKAKQADFLKNIKPVSYEVIWDIGKGKSGAGETDSTYLKYKFESAYHRFLTSMGSENEKIKRYVEAYETNGIIAPSMLADVAINYKDYDYTDERIRLILAIHYLTLNSNN